MWKALAPLLVVGCGSQGGGNTWKDGGPDGAPIELRVGTGTTDFVDIPDSGILEVIKGPQGGIHLIVNARAAEMDQPGNPDDPGDQANPITRFEAFALDGGVMHWVDQLGVPLPPYHLGWFAGASGGLEIGGHILRLHIPEGFTPDTYIDQVLQGRQLRIRVTTEQVNGRRGSGETVVITRKSQ